LESWFGKEVVLWRSNLLPRLLKRQQLSGWQLLFWLFLTLMIRSSILTTLFATYY
jgi:hypothetical protein